MSPKSSAAILIWRRSIARIVPSSIGTSYVFPVRLSVIVRLSLVTAASGFLAGLVSAGGSFVGVLMRDLRWVIWIPCDTSIGSMSFQ